jgi:hypothetical protein
LWLAVMERAMARDGIATNDRQLAARTSTSRHARPLQP